MVVCYEVQKDGVKIVLVTTEAFQIFLVRLMFRSFKYMFALCFLFSLPELQNHGVMESFIVEKTFIIIELQGFRRERDFFLKTVV